MYNAHIFAYIFEEKCGCALYTGIMITCHGYNNGYSNPVYYVQKNMGACYTQQNMVLQVAISLYLLLCFLNPHPTHIGIKRHYTKN